MAFYKHLEILQDFEKYVKDKKTSAKAYYRYLLTRCLRMFQYKNLPDSIPHEILDRYLFENGIALITKVNDKLRVFYGNLGGPQDVYYRPTTFIVSNPHLKVNGEIFTANIPVFECETFDVGQPTGVLIRNDTEWIGLHPLLARYAYLLSENTLTLRTADVMLRIIALITAKTDKEQASAIEYLKSIEKGELGVIGESTFHEGVEMQSPPSNNGSYLTQFIEYQQYLKGSFFNEIGLSANYNMKREAIGKGESTLDDDALLPLCDNMLKCRREDIERVNQMFGTNIEVEFSSSWLSNRIEALSTLSTMGQPTSFGSFGGAQMGNGDIGGDDSDDADEEKEQNEPNELNEPNEPKEEQSQGKNEPNELDEPNEPDEPNEDGENGDENGNDESRINDLSQDEEYIEILEKVSDASNNEVVVNPQIGGEDDAGEEEGSKDKADIPAN